MQKALTVIVILVLVSAVNAAVTIPGPPDWWQVPPDSWTRLQHHSFHADPNLNLAPDWTYDGYTPSIQDQWTMPQGITYNNQIPNPWGFYWQGGTGGLLNDNIGAYLSGPATLTKRMGNLRNDEMVKEFYALIIWQGPGSVTLNVTSEPGTSISATTVEMGEAGWLASWITGTITPQPDWEDFSFAFSGSGVYVDEVYIGTHCVPEPATLGLLLTGIWFGIRRRR